MKKYQIVSFALIVVCLLTLFTGCDLKKYEVKYEITGPSVLADNISYTDSDGKTVNLYMINIPWEKTITFNDSYDLRFYVLIGIINTVNNYTYTARILVDGKEAASSITTSNSVSVRHKL